MKKYRLLPNGASKTRYGTVELTLRERVTKRVSLENGSLILSEGTKILMIDEDAKISEEILREFALNYFEDDEKVFKRLNAIVNNKTDYKPIF